MILRNRSHRCGAQYARAGHRNYRRTEVASGVEGDEGTFYQSQRTELYRQRHIKNVSANWQSLLSLFAPRKICWRDPRRGPARTKNETKRWRRPGVTGCSCRAASRPLPARKPQSVKVPFRWHDKIPPSGLAKPNSPTTKSKISFSRSGKATREVASPFDQLVLSLTTIDMRSRTSFAAADNISIPQAGVITARSAPIPPILPTSSHPRPDKKRLSKRHGATARQKKKKTQLSAPRRPPRGLPQFPSLARMGFPRQRRRYLRTTN